MYNILVIHPEDSSTKFLCPIYERHMNQYTMPIKWTVVRGNVSSSQLKRLIKECDKVIMLGHGCEYGLFAPTSPKEPYGRLIINSKHVEFLREKECIGIWCNANIFFEKYGLKGFYTGMIISELEEAQMCSVKTDKDELLDQNFIFGDLLGDCIMFSPKGIYTYMTRTLSENKCEVAKFNRENLFCS